MKNKICIVREEDVEVDMSVARLDARKRKSHQVLPNESVVKLEFGDFLNILA